MDVSIIIVNWNVKNLLQKCLESLFVFIENLHYEIIVVDNNSSDDSQDMLSTIKAEHKNFQVIFNKENFGFARANNHGLKIASGKYILFMNPDMEIVENTPAILYKFMEKNFTVAACTCQLQYGDGSRQANIKRDPTLWSQIWILYKLHHVFRPRFLKNYLAKDFDYTRTQTVEQIMGALVFIKADVIKKIGGWPQEYFIWWEDVDLCTSLRKMGEKIMYTPDSRVIHYESKSFAQKMSLGKQKMFNQSMLIYFKKYHGKFAFIILKIINLDSLCLAWLAQIFKFKPKSQAGI